MLLSWGRISSPALEKKLTRMLSKLCAFLFIIAGFPDNWPAQDHHETAGWEFVYVLTDDASRMADDKIIPDEKMNLSLTTEHIVVTVCE